MYNKEYILENELPEGDSNRGLEYIFNDKKFVIYTGYSTIKDILYFKILDASKYGTESYQKDAIRINMLKPEYMYKEEYFLSKEEKINLILLLHKEALDSMKNPIGISNWEYLISATNDMMGYSYPLNLPIPDYRKLEGVD